MKKDTNTLLTSIILLLVIYYVYTLLIYQNDNRKKCVKYHRFAVIFAARTQLLNPQNL